MMMSSVSCWTIMEVTISKVVVQKLLIVPMVQYNDNNMLHC